MSKTYYKLVYFDGDNYTSISRLENFTLKYKIKEKTIPDKGKIFVFENLPDLIHFARFWLSLSCVKKCDLPYFAIMRGFGKKSNYQNKYICNYYKYLDYFWQDISLRIKEWIEYGYIIEKPQGTVLLDEFTPTSMLKEIYK